jgi:hypothetical protein
MGEFGDLERRGDASARRDTVFGAAASRFFTPIRCFCFQRGEAAASEAAASGMARVCGHPPTTPTSKSGLEMVVHPAFTHCLKVAPEIFCPLDRLPDDVINNVLVHLVGPARVLRPAPEPPEPWSLPP